MKVQYIAEYRGVLTRGHLCRLMGVSERGLHAWKHRPPSHRQRRDMVLLAHIRDQYRLSLGSYGRPRMTEELNELGVGQRRVGRLMRQNGIQVIRSRKFKRTTDSDHALNIAPNLLQQDFTASGPNQKWAGDITYVWTREGWVYLAVFSRRVVGVGDQQPHEAGSGFAGPEHGRRDPKAATRLHSSHGPWVAICAHDYQKMLQKNGFKVSMSGKGNCYDNSAPSRQICDANRLPGNGRKLFQVTEGRTGLAKELPNPPRGRSCPLRIHQRLIQPAPETLSPRLEITRGLRTKGRLT